MANVQLEWFDIGKGFYLLQNYPIYGKMFQPYEINRPSGWHWDEDFYTLDKTNSFDLTGFQQGNEVFAGTWCLSNQGESSASVSIDIYFDQKVNGHWQNPGTANWYYTATIPGKSEEQGTYANCAYIWAGVDTDEIRPGITDYRLRYLVDGVELQTVYFDVYNLSFDTTPCNNGFLRVEGANLCYVPPCYYSGSESTGYKHRIQYDTGYSGATGQTPGMIWIPNDSTDHHIYYTTSNGVVRRTKETYPRPYNPSSTWYSKRGHIWMTPSTYYSTEETGYNYICYLDASGYKRRLGPGEVD